MTTKKRRDSFTLLFHKYRFFLKDNRCYCTMPLYRLYNGFFQSGNHIPKRVIIFNRFSLFIATDFECFTLASSLEAIEHFLEKIQKRYNDPNLSIIMQELLLNAFEYGSLQISFNDKERLIAQDSYTTYLQHQKSPKNIFVRLAHIASFIVVQIEDEGEGFNAYNYDRQNRLFSGRGIVLSKKLATLIAYNDKGNCTTFLHRIENGKKTF